MFCAEIFSSEFARQLPTSFKSSVESASSHIQTKSPTFCIGSRTIGTENWFLKPLIHINPFRQFLVLFGNDESQQMQMLLAELVSLSLQFCSSNMAEHTDLVQSLLQVLSQVLKKSPRLFLSPDLNLQLLFHFGKPLQNMNPNPLIMLNFIIYCSHCLHRHGRELHGESSRIIPQFLYHAE